MSKSLSEPTTAEGRRAERAKRSIEEREARSKLRSAVDSAQQEANAVIDGVQAVANQVVDTTQDVVDTAIEFADALRGQIGKVLSGLDPGKLLILMVKAAELAGDSSFLDGWRIDS